MANRSREHCQQDMQRVLDLCEFLGVPLAPEKIIGPSQVLVYLGIEIDIVNGVARLPADKLAEAKQALQRWNIRKKATKRELLAIIGFLGFAAKVVKPGRIFIRRLIDLSTTVSSYEHFVYLNAEARADLQWWKDFLPEWNGVELLHTAPISSDEILLFTDASNMGYGCVYGNKWCYGPWQDTWADEDIYIKEFFAIWVAVFTWGDLWKDKQILIMTDNIAARDIWAKGSSPSKSVMKIVRAMFMFAAQRNTNILLQHVPGRDNILADSLSRFQVNRFRTALPTADLEPTLVSPTVWAI